MSNIGTRLEEFLQSKFGKNRGWLTSSANALGMDSSAVKKYITNTTTPGPAVQAKLRALGCDVEWLMTGLERGEQLERIDTPVRQIPVFEFVKAGGKTMALREEPSEYIYSTTKDKSLYGVKVKGSSMEPLIRPGEIVMASKTAEVKDGDICIVTFEDGETCLKRIYFHDHSCQLISENKEFPPQIYKKSEIRFIHRVVERITKF